MYVHGTRWPLFLNVFKPSYNASMTQKRYLICLSVQGHNLKSPWSTKLIRMCLQCLICAASTKVLCSNCWIPKVTKVANKEIFRTKLIFSPISPITAGHVHQHANTAVKCPEIGQIEISLLCPVDSCVPSLYLLGIPQLNFGCCTAK